MATKNQNDPIEIAKQGLVIAKQSRNLGRATLIITTIGIGLIVWQIYFSPDKKQFEQLLRKTDTVLTKSIEQSKISDSLLHLNIDIESANENANKMRFISAIFRLGAIIGDSAYAMQVMMPGDGIGIYVNEVAPILESQLNNPFLCKDSAMLRKWNNAYVHLIIVGQGERPLISEDGKQFMASEDGNIVISERAPIPIDKISKIKLSRYFYDAWKRVNEAYLYCGKRMQKDFSKLIK